MVKAVEPKEQIGEKGETVSASALAKHLDCVRSYLDKLVTAGVVEKLPGGGYDLDAARTAYIHFLRRERAQSPRSAAEVAFMEQRIRALTLRNEERAGRLIQLDEALATTAEMVGAMNTALSSLPARVAGRDLQLRRRLEQAVFDIRTELADQAEVKAAALAKEQADVVDD